MTRFALENDRITWVLLLLIAFAGAGAYASLPRAEDPGFVIRAAQVVTFFPGASPERVEQLVTDKIEKAIQRIPELDYVESESKTGVSVVTVSFKEAYDDMRPIFDNLRRKVEEAARQLPDAASPPIVNDEFGDVFGIIVGLTGEGLDYADLDALAEDVRDELLLLSDVAKVDVYGAQEERIFVEFDTVRMAELGISPTRIAEALAATNVLISGGELLTDAERIIIEPTGNFESVDQLARTVLGVPGRDELLYLGDVTQVRRGYVEPPEQVTHVGGTPGLALAVSMREGGNISALGVQVTATLDRVLSSLPVGVHLEVITFQPQVVDEKVGDFVVNLLEAIVIVMAVMFLFLGLRAGVVVSSLVPMAMLMTLALMRWPFDIGLDQMSLASLIIALGMLVDNGIVMTESIQVQMEEGRTVVEAAVGSAGELRVPLLISSLTTAAAFSPIFLAESSTGEYTTPIFLVVTLTLLSSWFLAMTLIPLLATRFLRRRRGKGGAQTPVQGPQQAPQQGPELASKQGPAKTPAPPAHPEAAFDSALYRGYRRTLLFALRHRLLTLAGVAAVFAGALLLFGRVPRLFFPPNDRPLFTAGLTLPAGTTLARTEGMVAEVERFMAEELKARGDASPGVTSWISFIGSGGPRYTLSYTPEVAAPEYAFLLVNTTSYEVLPEVMARLERFVQPRFPGLEIDLQPSRLGPPVQKPVAIRLTGRDTALLFDAAEALKAQIAEEPGTYAISDDWGARTKKLIVDVAPERARRAGVTNEDVAVSLQTVFDGLQATEFREDDELIPVLLRSGAADRHDLGKIESLNVFSPATDRAVPLAQVADLELVWDYSKILRRDRLRTVTVEAALRPGQTAASVLEGVRPWLDGQQAGWPLGMRWEVAGEVEKSEKANASIGAKLPIAFLLIVLLLVVQFNSIRRPVIILLTIPLALVGVSVGLVVTGSYFGFMTLLGVISLAGIVINNAIVLIDRIDLEIRENGLEPRSAILVAAQRRLRPILLTTVTTVGGLLPLWLGGGPMWEPLAIAIIFGLIFATGLTLGVVPLLYALFFGVRFRAPG